MKVKVGNTIYDGEREPVMVILTDQDKKNIANMDLEATKYCVYPTEGLTPEHILNWMRESPIALQDVDDAESDEE